MTPAQKKAELDPWISLVEAARMLGESRMAVLTKAVKGEVEAKHIAGRTVVSRESVQQLLAARATRRRTRCARVRSTSTKAT